MKVFWLLAVVFIASFGVLGLLAAPDTTHHACDCKQPEGLSILCVRLCSALPKVADRKTAEIIPVETGTGEIAGVVIPAEGSPGVVVPAAGGV